MLQRWLRLHGGSLLLMTGAIGFVLLIAATRNRYLSPDEALHFELVKSPGLLDVYRNSRSNSHPPLFFLLLHLWIGFGRTELWLRLLPAILGFAFLWSLWRWGGCLSGKAAGFFALLAAAFSPACLPLSMGVRNYSLLLLLFALALLQFERAVEDRSTLGMAAFSVVLYLAILAHYSALFLTASLFVYAPIRFWS